MTETAGAIRIKRAFFIVVSVAAFLHAGGPGAMGAAKILAGKHTVLYDIVNPTGVDFLPNYSNNSFSQKILQEDEFSKRVLVEANLSPLGSSAPFPVDSRSLRQAASFLGPEKNMPVGEPGIAGQARSLVKGTRTVHEAVAAIYNWIVDNHTYDAARNTPQDAKSVFYSRRGSCVGYTHLAITMLRTVGIPARYAHGYLPPGYDWGISKKYWGVQISGGGFHGWVEIFYPDIGWSFSDLLHSRNFVDPFHILRYIDGVSHNPRTLPGTGLDVEEATTFTIFREENGSYPIDLLPRPAKDILARQSEPQRFGTIWGSIRDAAGKPILKGSAVLWEGIQGKTSPFEKGLYSLVGLEDGTYRVTIRAEGYGEAEKTVKARRGEVKQVDFVLMPSGPSNPAPSKPRASPGARP